MDEALGLQELEGPVNFGLGLRVSEPKRVHEDAHETVGPQSSYGGIPLGLNICEISTQTL